MDATLTPLRLSVNWHSTSVNWQRLLVLLLVVATCCTSLTVSPSAPAPARVQADLLALAASQPESQVRIIIQQLSATTPVAQQLADMGAHNVRELPMIHGLAATVPARLVPLLGAIDGVRWISRDVAVVSSQCNGCVPTDQVSTAYWHAVGTGLLANRRPGTQGQGITIAVVDSGIQPSHDLYHDNGTARIFEGVSTSIDNSTSSFWDGYGHGDHVAGIIASNGRDGGGTPGGGSFVGIAPQANLISVRVADAQGAATAESLINGLQWIFNNHASRNIRVVNISMNTTAASDYHTDPINAAVQSLWFQGVVVVVSAGNSGADQVFSPGNDPFAITVGASDDKGTRTVSDDAIAPFSAYQHFTFDGRSFNKPDLVAPGVNIISRIYRTDSTLVQHYPGEVVHIANDGLRYFRMSGTSMAAPMVTAAAALMLQANPNLTPDQVKYRLTSTAVRPNGNFASPAAGAGLLNVDAAVRTTTTTSANQDMPVSRLLSGGTTTFWTGAAVTDSGSWRTRSSTFYSSGSWRTQAGRTSTVYGSTQR
ncbi:MAG: S8 family serine peptidase [Chloroflexaceae bacterium]|jgi:serine protease AprX|nr:S8 family serine peptidase [Chloroflexaceae bacterium]